MSRGTAQREAIWAALESAPGPLLPEGVLALAQPACASLGLATVYREIRRLESADRLRRVTGIDGRARYEPERKPHHHFQCRSCDRVFDVPGCAARGPSQLEQRLPDGFVLESHAVWLHGVCSACA